MKTKRNIERVAVRKRRIQRTMNKLDAIIDMLRTEHEQLARLKAKPSIKDGER